MLITLPPGTNAQVLLSALREAHTAALNTRGAGGTVLDVYNGYIRWSNAEIGRLSHLVTTADLERLVMTRRYWLLQQLDPVTHGDLVNFVKLEIDDRVAAFGAAYEALAEQLHHWSGRTGVVAVPDTNIYLHHADMFDEIDWLATLGAERVHLVVPLLVVDELDNAKSSGKQDVRTSARVTLRRLDAFPTPCNSAGPQPPSSAVCLTTARTGAPSTGGNNTVVDTGGSHERASLTAHYRPICTGARNWTPSARPIYRRICEHASQACEGLIWRQT